MPSAAPPVSAVTTTRSTGSRPATRSPGLHPARPGPCRTSRGFQASLMPWIHTSKLTTIVTAPGSSWVTTMPAEGMTNSSSGSLATPGCRSRPSMLMYTCGEKKPSMPTASTTSPWTTVSTRRIPIALPTWKSNCYTVVRFMTRDISFPHRRVSASGRVGILCCAITSAVVTAD